MGRRWVAVAVACVFGAPSSSAEWCDAGAADAALCVGSDALRARWQGGDMPRGSTKWTAAERSAVRRALAAAPLRVGDLALPKIFIYPFPREFEDFHGLLAAHLSPGELQRYSRNVTYFDFAGGIYPLNRGSEAWSRPAEGRSMPLRWRPSARAVGEWKEASADERARNGGKAGFCEAALRRGDGRALDERCMWQRFSQHATGHAVHRALEASYPRIVTSARDADLFFVPDHFITTTLDKMKLSRQKWCAIVGPVWLRHLRSFHARSDDGEENGPTLSYLERRRREDHFYVIGRAWHHPADRKKEDNLKRLEHFGVSEDCGYRWTAMRGAHRLVLESQYNYNRGCAKLHPIPYQSFLPWSDRNTWGRGWFAKDADSDARRNVDVAAFFLDTDKENAKDYSGTRDKFSLACAAMGAACDRIDDRSLKADYFPDVYRNATFTLQPCGHSAVRKGIVDSLHAGSVPVLAWADPRSDRYVSAKDQRDLWPWNWPQQGASAVILAPHQLDDVSKALAEVDADQLHLMRRVIAQAAPGMAYPINASANDRTPKDDPDRPPNAIELIAVNLHVASSQAKGDKVRKTCEREVRTIFNNNPTELRTFYAEQAAVFAFAKAMGTTSAFIEPDMFLSWWRRR